jgi:hypothetical protein
MSEYMAIADVGQSIISVLWQEMQSDSSVNTIITTEDALSLQSPADLQDDDSVHLSVYLYRILEDPHTKNRSPVPGNGANLRKAPLTLDLYYMLTPLLGLPRDQQLVLGKTMQILYDRTSLSGPDLQGSLAGGDPIRVILNPVTLEETTRVWQALELSYRLSVCYIARVVIVDSTVERLVQPVLQTTAIFGQQTAGTNVGVLP